MARDHAPQPTGEERSLWLEARLGESTWVFELAPTEDRAIVVGSLLRAHIRIDRKGIFPVHFHFEREGDSVHLVPAYRGDLFVDGVPVSTPKRIEEAGVIDFSGTQLCVRVVADRALLATNTDARGWDEQRALEADIPGRGFLDWCDITVSALPSTCSINSGAETRALTPLCDVHLSRTEPPSPSSSRPRAEQESAPAHANAEFLPTPVDGVPIAAQLKAWFDVPPRGNSNDNAVPGFHAADEVHPNPRRTRMSRVRAPTLLVRIGLLASDKPVLVSFFACAGAVMLTLALFGVRQCFRTIDGHHVVAQEFAATPASATGAPRALTGAPVATRVESSNTSSPFQPERDISAQSAEASRPIITSRPRKSGKPNAQARTTH